MKKTLALLLTIVLAVSFVGLYPTFADEPPPPEENEVVIYGSTKSEEPASAAASSCQHETFARNPATAGPLHTNSEVIVLRAVFCSQTNTALIDVSSVWWGYQSKVQRLWGTVNIADPSGRVVRTLVFDTSNSPDVSNSALNVPLEWQAPWDSTLYKFTANINVLMLPENSGPEPVTVIWSWLSGSRKLYLPVYYNSGGGGNCGGYGIRMQSILRSESWSFSSPGVTVAMLRFGHSERVTFKWIDSSGNELPALPGTGHVIQLTWGNHGYRDYPKVTSLTLQATKLPYEGDLPYLATPYDLTYHYVLGSTVCRITIPMIWDP